MPNFLIIEDNLDHQELLLDIISSTFEDQTSTRVFDHLTPGLEYLANHHVDLLLCDLQLPDSPVEETVQILQGLNTPVPIIVLTSLNDTALAQTLVKSGIQDYLPKEELTNSLLYRACTYARERKRNQLSAEERNRDYQAFCYSLTHDFNGELRKIKTFSRFLRQSLEGRIRLSDNEIEYLGFINSNLNHISGLIAALYDYLAVESERTLFTRVPIVPLLEEAVRSLETVVREAQAQIKVSLAPSLSLEGRPAHLLLLFQNLIGNGIKYNQRTPQITVLQVKSRRPNHIALAVRDNGIGIKKEFFEKIFIPFQRLHAKEEYPGSGLGLNIARRIAQQHNGHLWVESEYGVGSTFYVELPFAQPRD